MTQSTIAMPAGMQITGEIKPGYEQVLTPEALALVSYLLALDRTYPALPALPVEPAKDKP